MPISTQEKRRIVAAVIALVVTALVIDRAPDDPIPRHTGQPGSQYLEELFAIHNDERFYDVMRMDRDTFNKVDRLLQANGLQDRSRYRHTHRVELPPIEKIAILIHLLKGLSVRQIMERFQHSGATVSRAIDEMLDVQGPKDQTVILVRDSSG